MTDGHSPQSGSFAENAVADAKKVEIDYTAGKFTVTADANSVLATELNK